MITITFYKFNGDSKRTVNKILTDGVEFQGVLKDDLNVVNPTLTIRRQETFGFNYCYIPVFNRYYFVDSINVTGADTTELKLSIDVLTTYKDQILSATATVKESDNPDKYLSTRENIYSEKPNFEKIDFPNKELLSSTGTIIMVTIKGK